MAGTQVPMRLRPLHYFWATFRRQWRSDISTTFLTPVLYLASIGAGLGSFIKGGQVLASLGGEDYLSFVAPALLVTTAMQVAVSRSTYDVYGCKNWWSGAYRSMLAAPLSVGDIVTGHPARVGLASAFYLAVSAAFGAVHSPAAAADLVVGPVVGLAFAAPIIAYAITVRHEQPFVMIFRLVMVPLFLCSGTFFPLSQLPTGLRYIAYVLPLWHGVELSRGLYQGSLGAWPALGHLAYLVVVIAVGSMAASRTYRKELAP